MKNYLTLDIYIDANKDLKIVPYKTTKIGYLLAVEPYKIVKNTEWDKMDFFIIQMINEIDKNPITDEIKTNVIENMSGIKSFKQFSKKHICILVKYEKNENIFEISNQPRLPDGSYGVQKDFTMEYSNIYKCTNKTLKENFIRAYEDSQQYLKRIGSIK